MLGIFVIGLLVPYNDPSLLAGNKAIIRRHFITYDVLQPPAMPLNLLLSLPSIVLVSKV
jgi:hypothetical protein